MRSQIEERSAAVTAHAHASREAAAAVVLLPLQLPAAVVAVECLAVPHQAALSHSLAGQSGFSVEVLTLETATAARVVFAACASATTANIHLKTCDNKRKLALHKITFHEGPDFERST